MSSNPFDALAGKSFGCGEQLWPNVEALIGDAAGFRYEKVSRSSVERVLAAAILSNGGELRITAEARAKCDGSRTPKLETTLNAHTGDWIVRLSDVE